MKLAYLSSKNADLVVRMEGKYIKTFSWKLVSPKRQRWEVSTNVFIPDSEFPGKYRFDGMYQPEKYEFAFLGPGGQPLRYISKPHSNHWDPILQAFANPFHKHYWHSSVMGHSATYVPDDINWSSPSTVLIDFLKECRITCNCQISLPALKRVLRAN